MRRPEHSRQLATTRSGHSKCRSTPARRLVSDACRVSLFCFRPNASASGLAAMSSLCDAGYGSFAHAEYVPVRVFEPRAAGGTDLSDEVSRLRRFVLLEGDSPRGQLADDAFDVINLEVRHG